MVDQLVRRPLDAVRMTPTAERILAAVDTLFYTRGIRATGVDAIAEAAGCTKKTLYDRFGSKDGLIAAYLDRRDRRWHAFLTEQLERRRAVEPEQVVVAMFAALGDWMTMHERGCGFINAHAELAAPDHAVMPVIVGQKRWLRDEFARLATAAGFLRCGELADRLLLLHEGALVTRTVADLPDSAQIAQRAAEDLLAGWPRAGT
jgi:AcrR family transcriptional regulator